MRRLLIATGYSKLRATPGAPLEEQKATTALGAKAAVCLRNHICQTLMNFPSLSRPHSAIRRFSVSDISFSREGSLSVMNLLKASSIVANTRYSNLVKTS